MAKDVDKLLGGHATGTLTEEERKALYEAALDDQQLFNALADEEALKELLDDPESRRHLLEALETGSSRSPQGRLAPLWEAFRKPLNLTLAGSLVAAGVAVFVFVNLMQDTPRETVGLAARKTQESLLRRDDPSARPEEAAGPSRSTDLAASPAPPPRPRVVRPSPSDRVAETSLDTAQTPGREGALLRDLPGPLQSQKIHYGLSLGQPVMDGPARQLFLGSSDLERRREQPTAAAPALRSMRRTEGAPQPGREKSVASPPGHPEFQLRTAPARMGLRLGLEKEGPDGLFVGIEFDAPLGERDRLRLTAEANADGYLYLAQEQNGRWHRLFPSPEASRDGLTHERIHQGQRIIIPLIAFAPDQNRLLIILSGTEVPGLPAVLSPRAGDASDIGGTAALDERWRSSASKGPVLREEGTDKTIYFVPGAPDSTAPLVIEFHITAS